MSTEPDKPVLDFRQAAFKTSAETLAQCPPEASAEVAFIGRSNAGKSSAINALTEQPKLARTSKTPGRTQLMNFFQLAENTYLVDLPGFGYAQVPPAVKARWERNLDTYMRNRQALRGLVLLMDCRHPFREFDELMLQWCADTSMPVHILLTKADKLKSGAKKSTLLQARARLAAANLEGIASAQLFSTLKRDGIGELKKVLAVWLRPAPGQESAHVS